MDRIRYFVEECDSLQGIQVFVDIDSVRDRDWLSSFHVDTLCRDLLDSRLLV